MNQEDNADDLVDAESFEKASVRFTSLMRVDRKGVEFRKHSRQKPPGKVETYGLIEIAYTEILSIIS